MFRFAGVVQRSRVLRAAPDRSTRSPRSPSALNEHTVAIDRLAEPAVLADLELVVLDHWPVPAGHLPVI
jgi:hypothetical protein